MDNLNSFCQKLREGNRKLFDDLFSDYYVNLCRFAYTYVKNSEAAEEIVQEMFIAVRALNYIRNLYGRLLRT
jgi:DNA-directed RNA polymerase specialized sigma24 family protein